MHRAISRARCSASGVPASAASPIWLACLCARSTTAAGVLGSSLQRIKLSSPDGSGSGHSHCDIHPLMTG
jgi:hypothetical protein